METLPETTDETIEAALVVHSLAAENPTGETPPEIVNPEVPVQKSADESSPPVGDVPTQPSVLPASALNADRGSMPTLQ
jgi:hypothetical protein